MTKQITLILNEEEATRIATVLGVRCVANSVAAILLEKRSSVKKTTVNLAAQDLVILKKITEATTQPDPIEPVQVCAECPGNWCHPFP